MGKGARTRLATAEAVKAKKEEELKAKAKKKKNALIYSIVALALVICVVGGVCVKAFYYNNGTYLRKQDRRKERLSRAQCDNGCIFLPEFI